MPFTSNLLTKPVVVLWQRAKGNWNRSRAILTLFKSLFVVFVIIKFIRVLYILFVIVMIINPKLCIIEIINPYRVPILPSNSATAGPHTKNATWLLFVYNPDVV